MTQSVGNTPNRRPAGQLGGLGAVPISMTPSRIPTDRAQTGAPNYDASRVAEAINRHRDTHPVYVTLFQLIMEDRSVDVKAGGHKLLWAGNDDAIDP